MKPTALGILRSDVSFDCNSRLHCTSKVSFGSDSEVVASPSYVRFTLRSGGKDGVIGRLSLWIAEDFRCCESG
jgi:hypothetical protein